MENWIGRNLKKGMEGYFTVEAAMIMPIVCVVLLLIIYLWFFQYNRCLMEQDAGVLALRGVTMEAEDNEERVTRLRAQELAMYKDKYVAWEYDEAVLGIGHGIVSVKQAGRIHIPFGMLGSVEGVATSTATYENHILSPVSFVRNYRKMIGGK